MDLHPEQLTWASLLARWIEFAQSAVALPDDATGRAWKRAVPPIIGLQAVTMALGEVDQLGTDQRALGIDRANILIERHTKELLAAFHVTDTSQLHPMLIELLGDARRAISGTGGGN
ncbi:MAG: hypothetical protein ACYC26_06885 [Phycisphaerales bacterium]